MIRIFSKPILAVLLAMYLFALSGSPAAAGIIGSVASQPLTGKDTRQQEINAIQRTLENEIVRAKLEAYGLTPDETRAKLQELSDEQIHLLAQASDDLLAGADGEGVVIALLIILIVVLIIYLTGHRVIVK